MTRRTAASSRRWVFRLSVFAVWGAAAVWALTDFGQRETGTVDVVEESIPESGDVSSRLDSLRADAPIQFVKLPKCVDIAGRILNPRGREAEVATVAVFLSMDCPISNAALPGLNRMAVAYRTRGVQMTGVYADVSISHADALIHQTEFAIEFPLVIDRGGEWQDTLAPTHTPQAVVVTGDGEIVYSGRIDNRYADLGRPRLEVTQCELEDAILAAISGERPMVASTAPVGCLIEDRNQEVRSSRVTYSREIAPVVSANCVECHRAGEATPFALSSFAEVRSHARQIAHVVEQRIMPPWKPVRGFGQFQNEHVLTDAQIALFQEWVDCGMPEGDVAELPTPPRFTDGWQLGQPDLILEMPEAFSVPADGRDLYQHFVIPIELTQNRLVRAAEFRPGNPEVVHHSFMYIDVEGEGRALDEADPGPGYERFGGVGFAVWGTLGGWGPGGQARQLPEGMGRPIPRDSDLVLQIHYHPTGRAQQDRSRVGIYFADEDAKQWVSQIMVSDVDLEIPAGEPRHHFHAEYRVPVATTLLDATPHMHLLGREMKVIARHPDGRVQPLIWIDDWDFYWQDGYQYRVPIRLPAGTVIEMDAWYDNSISNPLNPNSPPRMTRFGEGSDDEMGICYFQVAADSHADLVSLTKHSVRYYQEQQARHDIHREQRLRAAGNEEQPASQTRSAN